jgi:hypothetical protein
LEQAIKNIASILAAEAAIEAKKNSWGTWLLSPIYKEVKDSEEEKARKDRVRQERGIEKDMKERRLELKKADVKKEEDSLKRGKEDVDAADLCDDRKIGEIQARIRLRENRERQERDKVERERLAKIWKQEQEQREQRDRERMERERVERERMAKIRKQEQEQWEQRNRERQEKEKVERDRMAKIWKQQQEQREKRDREAAKAHEKTQAEWRAAEQKRWEEEIHWNRSEGSTSQAHTSTCRHDGWWPKVQGRTACPECNETWTYLLQCPSCAMKACPKCQNTIRPKKPRNRAKTFQKNPPRARTPSPAFYNDYY